MAIHLVTGAAGFLGRYLCRALIARGLAVRALDLHIPEDAEPEIDWRVGDVRDPDGVWRACEGATVVYHLASLIPQRKAGAATMQAVNVAGTQHVLEGAQAANVSRVVYLSSAEVYGIPAELPCREDSPLRPLNEYGRNKIAAEGLCQQALARGLEISILRPPTIVGPGLTEPFLVGLLRDVQAGAPITLLGRGANRYHFVHAEDVVAACLLASDHPAAVGEAFNIAADAATPIRTMVETIVDQVGSTSKIRSIPVFVARVAIGALHLIGKAPLAPEHLALAVSEYVFDTDKARRLLGWTPKWSNVAALLDTYRSLDQSPVKPTASHRA